MVEQILTIFREVRDPRDFMARHDLGEMLFLVLCGLLCGEKTCVDIADFAAGHEEEFREVLIMRHGTPGHDTISRVLRLLDPRELKQALAACLSAMGQSLRSGAVLAVDGKALRRAYEAGQRHMPPLMVSVFDGLTRLSLAQTRAGAGGEAAAARTLLETLCPKGCTITADALHCRPDTATVIREAGAHYVLGLKTNQPSLYASAEAGFTRAPDALPHLTCSEHGHGRHEQRIASVVAAPAAARAKLPGLVAFGRPVACLGPRASMEDVLSRPPPGSSGRLRGTSGARANICRGAGRSSPISHGASDLIPCGETSLQVPDDCALS